MKHFLTLADWSPDELRHLIQMAVQLKMEWQTGGNRLILKNKVLGMVFQKPSLRTRVSFEVGMQHLGGHAIMLGPSEIGLGKRESVPDVARVLSGYVQGIMARVFDHEHVTELAKHASVPVINGLSDDWHPCQAMADALTIYEHFGRLQGIRFAYIGDGNNVAASLALMAGHFGMHYTIATPDGYNLSEAVLESAAELGKESGATFKVFSDPKRAVQDVDVVYTDTWVSMGQEAEGEERRAIMRPYQINAELMARAGTAAVVMHCLPAHRGDEITDEVADGAHSVIFQQAENRLHAQKAILIQLMA